MAIELPMDVIEASDLDPKISLFYGPPKVGKTSILADLPNNLFIDFEDGSDFISAKKVKINTVEELNELIIKIRQANKEKGGYIYDFITLDTITKLEDVIIPLANQIYRATPKPFGACMSNHARITLLIAGNS